MRTTIRIFLQFVAITLSISLIYHSNTFKNDTERTVLMDEIAIPPTHLAVKEAVHAAIEPAVEKRIMTEDDALNLDENSPFPDKLLAVTLFPTSDISEKLRPSTEEQMDRLVTLCKTTSSQNAKKFIVQFMSGGAFVYALSSDPFLMLCGAFAAVKTAGYFCNNFQMADNRQKMKDFVKENLRPSPKYVSQDAEPEPAPEPAPASAPTTHLTNRTRAHAPETGVTFFDAE